MDKRFAIVLVAAVIAVATSTALHYPPLRIGEKIGDFGVQYSDIVYGVFMDRFSTKLLQSPGLIGRKWFDTQEFMELMSGEPLCPAPYRDYFFEYPPVVGGLWFVTTCVSIRTAFGSGVVPEEVGRALSEAADLNYLLQSMVLSAAYVAMTAILYELCREVGVGWRRAVLVSLLPSTTMYLSYNWDALSAALIVSSLLCFSRSRYRCSGALAGLAVATKIVAYPLAIAMLYELLQRAWARREELANLTRFATGLAVGCGAPFLTIIALAPKGFAEIVAHFSKWYCEDCIYLLVPGASSTSALHAISLAITIAALTLVLSLPMADPRSMARAAFLAMGVSTLFSYIFPPQMWLELSPLAMLALGSKELRLFIAGDVLNAGIMLTFFKDREIRAALSHIIPGLEVKFDPWSLSSPVQWIAMARNIVVLTIWISCMATAVRNSWGSQRVNIQILKRATHNSSPLRGEDPCRP